MKLFLYAALFAGMLYGQQTQIPLSQLKGCVSTSSTTPLVVALAPNNGATGFLCYALAGFTITPGTATAPPTLNFPSFPPSFTFVDAEVPMGLLDGVNLLFVLAATPNPSTSLQVFRNGLLQRATTGGLSNDYLLNGNTITFTAPGPQPNDVLLVYYRK
jgi:hypothetical protein